MVKDCRDGWWILALRYGGTTKLQFVIFVRLLDDRKKGTSR